MNGSVRSKRSTNEGQSFGTSVTHTSTAVGPGTLACTATIALPRTAAGVWVLAWNDIRDDDGLVQRSDVYARSSTDGATWGAEQRADGGSAGAAQSSLGAIPAVSTNDVVLVYRDARDDPRSFNLYRNRSAADPLALGAGGRIDVDAGQDSPRGIGVVAVATDGAGRVYAAFSAFVSGAFTDVFVATSHDGGHSFGAPVRVGGSAAGTMMGFFPVIAAEPGGHIYLAYEINTGAAASGFGIREVRFNRSSDLGATWQASDLVLDSSMENSGPGYYAHWDRVPTPQVFAGAGRRVLVTWTNEIDVFLARSADYGASFTTNAVDQESRCSNVAYSQACVGGSTFVIAYEAPKAGSSSTSVWPATSKYAGLSWAPRVQVRPESAESVSDDHAVACDGAGGAVVVWSDFCSGDNRGALHAYRFTGASWLGDVVVAGPATGNNDYPRVTFASPTVAVVVWDNTRGPEVDAARSTDGGATFPSYQRLSSSPPGAPRNAAGRLHEQLLRPRPRSRLGSGRRPFRLGRPARELVGHAAVHRLGPRRPGPRRRRGRRRLQRRGRGGRGRPGRRLRRPAAAGRGRDAPVVGLAGRDRRVWHRLRRRLRLAQRPARRLGLRRRHLPSGWPRRHAVRRHQRRPCGRRRRLPTDPCTKLLRCRELRRLVAASDPRDALDALDAVSPCL